MRKKAMYVFLATICLLAGCGSDEKVISGDVENVVVENSQSQEAEEGETGEETADNAGGQEGSSHAGYVFEVKDVFIEIDAEAEEYISALGEPVSYFEAPSCAFGDLDKIYTYGGFEIDTYSFDGIDYISAVILQDDSVMTQEGLCIGDSVDRVEEVYGAPTSTENNMLVYEKDEMKLCFLTQDETIIAIEYRTMILE